MSRLPSATFYKKFKWFFDFLRFSPEARFEATKAIVEISNNYGDYKMSIMGSFAREMRNALAIISFMKQIIKCPTSETAIVVIGVVNGVEFKCAFLDGGASINAMLYLVFKMARIP